jgi:peptide/nickel transport system permease protein
VTSRAGRALLTRPFQGNASLRLGVGILAALILFSLAGALFLQDPNRQSLEDAYAPPGTAGHLLGTDQLGRDVMAWSAAGVRTALIVGLAVVVLAAAIGVLVGLCAGYLGGVVDPVLMRLVDLQLAIPPLLLFIAASVVIGGGITSLVLLVVIVAWVPYARTVRSKVLSERERAYIAAARLAGTPTRRMLIQHLLPATATLVLVLASLQVGLVLLWESGLSFLGLGLQPPIASLGFIISQGQSELSQAWWIVTFPGLTLLMLVLAFNLIGDGLRDWFQLDVRVLDQ